MLILPYSGDSFNIPEITFKDIFKLARAYDVDDDEQVINYLCKLYNIEHLNCIDKFFVICKVCELHITHTLHMSGEGGTSVDLDLNTILNNLNDVVSQFKKCNVNGVEINMDIPKCFFTPNDKDLFTAVIDSIIVEDVKIDFQKLTKEDKLDVMSSLPAAVFNTIKKYLTELDLTVTLFEGHVNRGISKIDINFLGFDPLYLIRSLYSEFPLITCREVIYYLSRKINSETLLNSTPVDIKYYLEEHGRENKENSNNGGSLGTIG
tara:strand:+ start:58 stop:849 length:792 start_codon:yes stop_codon:yes gene_type:complete